jgi:hypothetical protein
MKVVFLFLCLVAASKLARSQDVSVDSLMKMQRASDSLITVIDNDNDNERKIITGKVEKKGRFEADAFFTGKVLTKLHIRFKTSVWPEEVAYINNGKIFCIVKGTEKIYFANDVGFLVCENSIAWRIRPEDSIADYYAIIQSVNLLLQNPE